MFTYQSRICVENTCENMGFGQPLQGYLVTFFYITCFVWTELIILNYIIKLRTTYFDPYDVKEAMS